MSPIGILSRLTSWPEMLIKAIRLPLASGEDLKRADIWSLGMTLFVLLNPCVRYPYFDEIQAALREGKTPLQALEDFFITRKLLLTGIRSTRLCSILTLINGQRLKKWFP